MKKVLLTGINGMLGQQLFRTLETGYEITGLGRSASGPGKQYHSIDLADENALDALQGQHFDYIVHAAANVNLKDCEDFPEKAARIHVDASGRLARMFPSATILYISTDSVFDGVKGNFNENDTPNPLNAYARTKYEGELAVQAHHKNAYILRVNIYGAGSPSGKSLFEWGYHSLKAGQKISGFSNVLFNPLSITQLSQTVRAIMEHGGMPFGVYHLGIGEYLSKYEFLVRIADVFSLDKTLIAQTEYESKPGDIQRPADTTLDTGKICGYIDMAPLTVEGGIKDLIPLL